MAAALTTPAPALEPRQTSSGINANWALTTIFTPPGSCLGSNPYTTYTSFDNTPWFWRDYAVNHTRCWPPDYADQHSPGVSAQYSPGVCPGSYTAGAAYTTNGVATSWCCPSGMTYVSACCCTSTVTAATSIINAAGNTGTTSNFVAADWYIRVAWASSDLSSFSPASAPVTTAQQTSTPSSASSGVAALSSTATSQSAASSRTATASAHRSSAAANNGGGLSTGAQAGIGVGVALAALALLAALVFWFMHKRRKDKQTPVTPVVGPGEQKGVYAHYAPVSQNAPVEAPDTQRAPFVEAPDSQKPMPEMDGSNTVSELPGHEAMKGPPSRYA